MRVELEGGWMVVLVIILGVVVVYTGCGIERV